MTTEPLRLRLQVGDQIDDEWAAIVLRGAIGLGQTYARESYWGPSIGPIKDGWAEITMQPKERS